MGITATRRIFTSAGKEPPDPRLFFDMTRAYLSIGLLFAWVSLGWTKSGTAFGLPLQFGTAYHIVLQVCIALTFACLAGVRATGKRLPANKCVIAGTVVAILGVSLYHLASWLHINALFMVPSALSGIAQGFFMWGWLDRYRLGVSGTFIALAAGSGVGYLTRLFALLFGNAPAVALSFALPMLGALVFIIDTRPGTNIQKPKTSTQQTKQVALQTVSLLLCCFASGFASFVTSGDSEQTVFLRAFASFAFSVIGTFMGARRSTLLFATLSICTCICIALMLTLPAAPAWLPSLMFAGFWLLEIYAIAWFSQASGTAEISPRWALGLVAIYVLSSFNSGVSTLVPEQVAYATALVITVIAFALTSFGLNMAASHSPAETTVSKEIGLPCQNNMVSSSMGMPLVNLSEELIDKMASLYDLTSAERGVFAYLARGYSLKQISLNLGVSESTAKYHRRNVYQKCGVSSRQELINLVDHPQDA